MNKTAEKQQRQESILLSLKKLDYLNRGQIQRIHDLKGERNANRVLRDMGQYLSHFRHDKEYVYYLNKEGRERVKCEVIRKKTPNIQHFLLRNQLYIHLKCPHTWDNEYKITVKDTSIVCDAIYTWKNAKGEKIPILIEVDCQQPMKTNAAKIEKYRKIKELTGNEFHLLWVTEIESRRAKLTELMKGIQGKVYTLKDIK